MALCSHGGPRQVFLFFPSRPRLCATSPLSCRPSWVSAYTDIDAPIVQTARGGGGGHEPSPEQIGMLADMGFSAPQARKALRETVCGPNAVQVCLLN
jgi:hypothetical protein